MVKYNDKLNEEINRTFKNFNAKVRYNRTKTRGRGMIPQKVSVKAFKDKYSDKTRAEVMRQLKLYQSFSERKMLDKAKENSRLSLWEANYIKSNLDKTRKFYDREIEDLERIIGNQPEYHLRLHNRLNTLINQRQELDKDLSVLTEDQIKGFRAYINYAERSEKTKEQGFRLYLSQLERTMKELQYSKQDIDNLLNKFNVLSENEFTEMVRNEDMVDAVYDIIDSPKGRGKYELQTDEEKAEAKIQEIMSHADELIAKYKTTK